MKTLRDLFNHEIKDLYSAEKQFSDSISKFVNATSDNNLKHIITQLEEETKSQFDEIHSVCENLEINPGNTKCQAMEGLLKEADGIINSDSNKDVKDAGIIARIQRIAHYTISAYGTAVRFARELGLEDAAERLQNTLDSKYNADARLGKIAKNRINEEAMA